MTRDDVLSWALERVLNREEPVSAYYGALDAVSGTFDESRCAPAGFIDETPYCEGAREALLRLGLTEPVTSGRVQHGATVGG